MNKFIRVGILSFLSLVFASPKRSVFSQENQALSVTVDTFTVQASPFLAGKVDSALLFLTAKAVVEGDSVRHGWLLHFSPVELRSEEHFPFFPKLRFFRLVTPGYKVSPGHCVGVDRERGKAYFCYQSGVADDLGDMVLEQGIKISSDSNALEYFLEVLQIRGYLPVIVLDTVAEIRQFARYRERLAELSTSQLPPVLRMYRHLWKDKNFASFKKGDLSEERDSLCRVLESLGAGTVQPPAARFQKGQYFVQLHLARTRELFAVYKFSGFVSPEGLVSYTVKKLE